MTKTDIANLALSRIGAKTIMDLDDTTSTTARVCKTFFEPSVREMGRSHEWGCLKKRESIGRLAAAPAFGWDYQFQLPSDFLRLVRMNGHDVDEIQDYYVIEGGKLLTDEETAEIIYIAYEEDSTKYDSLFSEALSVLLASKIAVKIRQDEGLAAALKNEYETKTLPRARRIDGGETKRRSYDITRDSRWVRARGLSTNG